MKLTSKGRYAVTAILDLAFHSRSGPVRLSTIAKRQDISLSYLEQLFAKLRKHDLVSSSRGPGGGYALCREVKDISVGEIISAVDEAIETTNCKDKPDCKDGEKCLTHDLWDDLSNQIHDFLSSITLEQLMKEESIRAVAFRQDARMESPSATLD
jgi:Rrf2 family iron-sulfur cluster assembly transcriptional regulator